MLKSLVPRLTFCLQRSAVCQSFVHDQRLTYATSKPTLNPAAPSRGPQAYNIYFKEMQPVVAKEIGAGKPKEVMKIVASRWRALSDMQKQPYKDLCEEGRKEYRAHQAVAEAQKHERSARKRTGYQVFIQERLPQLFKQEGTAAEAMKVAGREWQALTEAHKEAYNTKAKQAREQAM